MKYLNGKNILITGGAGGVGWGIAKECAREGAKVVITDINEKKGREVLDEILTISGDHKYYHLDLRETKKFDAILEKIESETGLIDVLFNNAGINTPHFLLNMTEENWDNVQNINLKGHFFLTQKVVKKMIDNKVEGSVIFTSSVHQEIPSTPHYSTSKASIKILVKQMAGELAHFKIRVNGIAPGGIYISKKVENPEEANDESSVLLGGKNGIPRDIGRIAVVLASDYWSRNITGEVITVSGGQYLRSNTSS